MMKNAIIAVIVALFAVSCTTTQYVPVETTTTEWRERIVEKSDTVYAIIHDSIDVDRTADTVRITRWKTVTNIEYRNVFVRDTIAKVDSVQVPYPVEKSLTAWQQTKQEVGGIAMGILLAVVIAAVVWLVYRRRKK